MSGGATAAMWVGAAVGAYSAYTANENAQKAQSQQESAQNQAKASALKQEKAADEATNRANAKSPNTSAILDQAMQSGKGGASGTMLTGPQGIDPSTLSLGKSTLLGA
jgi:predicted ATP-dependent serine protease